MFSLPAHVGPTYKQPVWFVYLLVVSENGIYENPIFVCVLCIYIIKHMSNTKRTHRELTTHTHRNTSA